MLFIEPWLRSEFEGASAVVRLPDIRVKSRVRFKNAACRFDLESRVHPLKHPKVRKGGKDWRDPSTERREPHNAGKGTISDLAQETESL